MFRSLVRLLHSPPTSSVTISGDAQVSDQSHVPAAKPDGTHLGALLSTSASSDDDTGRNVLGTLEREGLERLSGSSAGGESGQLDVRC